MEVDEFKVALKLGHNMDAPRRSSRRREEKSYVEIPDSMIETIDSTHRNDASLSCKDKGMVHSSSGGGAVGLSNGDVEMESEDDEDEDLPLLPLPKVRKLKKSAVKLL